MTGDQSRTLSVGDRVCWGVTTTDLGTVIAKTWGEVTIDWDDGRTRTARLTNNDRWFFVQMYRWFPPILKVVTIIEPETLVRWHRAGFRRYWRWKSRLRGGGPQIDAELRALIRHMSMENLLWGAPRIHGELLKLGLILRI